MDSWILGDKLRCQAFQDSAMIQLLTYHEKHAIEPSTVCEAYQGSTPGSKLRKWAIDQFLYDIKAAEYEDSAEEKQDWMSQVELIENFGQDFINASLGWGSVDVVDPYMNGQKYMEVSTYKHDNSCECSRCGRRPPEVGQQEIWEHQLGRVVLCTCLRRGRQEMLLPNVQKYTSTSKQRFMVPWKGPRTRALEPLVIPLLIRR